MVAYKHGNRARGVSPERATCRSIDSSALVDQCRALIDGDVPAYVPVVRGGGKMHVRMLCLGRHWNGKTYTYEPTRSDFDGLPVPPLPDDVRGARARHRRGRRA